MGGSSKYLLVSLPLHNSASSTWQMLQEGISKNAFDTPSYRFYIPDLRIGTLDSLLALSDDLVKANSFVEGVTQKIQRQIEDLERASNVDSGRLTVEGVPVDSYITSSAGALGIYIDDPQLKNDPIFESL